jgi:hypothetical protein
VLLPPPTPVSMATETSACLLAQDDGIKRQSFVHLLIIPRT